MIQDILIPLIITILSILITTNFIGILVHYYILKHDIQDIHDNNLKIDLLQSLRPIYKIFFRRVLYHKDSDYFSSIKDHRKFCRYMNIDNIEYHFRRSYNRPREILLSNNIEELEPVEIDK